VNEIKKIGEAPWTNIGAVEQLKEFAEIYANRPIKDNYGGMFSPHLFAMYHTIKSLKPKVVIESGVFQGQGTYFIEKASPEAELFCVDIDMSKIKYRSNRARYFLGDITKHDWRGVSKSEAFVFLDDHVNAFKRTLQLQKLGFEHLMFEDNYVSDCYTLKLAFANQGYDAPLTNWRYLINLFLGRRQDWGTRANENDAKTLEAMVEIYHEFPPIFQTEQTRWGTAWDNSLPTPEPLLKSVDHDYQQIFLDEAKWYTWICYVKLKASQVEMESKLN
jgi:hypothetical protein